MVDESGKRKTWGVIRYGTCLILVSALEKANIAINDAIDEGGTTCTAAVMLGRRAYIAHVGAMEKNGVPVAIVSLAPFLKPQGWILSAGPDGIFQTSPTDTVLAGDDIGFILFTKKPG